MTALFKQGDRTGKDNYRPISILPTVSKVIERAVHSQLYDYLDSNNLLTVNQFGFRRARSTALALTQFTDEVLSNMDKGLVNGVVFIDLKKAFDTVDHVILLGKLKSFGISSNNLEWFHSYLSSRYQMTVIGQASSTSRKVSVGVKAMVLPILDYADVTWGDKSNTTLMNKIQLLQNKAAKLILNMPKHSSATEALDLLGWDTLEKGEDLIAYF